MEIDVVAVGMGLRFVEIESGNPEVCCGCLPLSHVVQQVNITAATCRRCNDHVLYGATYPLTLDMTYALKCTRAMVGACSFTALPYPM